MKFAIHLSTLDHISRLVESILGQFIIMLLGEVERLKLYDPVSNSSDFLTMLPELNIEILKQ
jgi:hypothetical protein